MDFRVTESSGESESSDDSDIEGETASALFMVETVFFILINYLWFTVFRFVDNSCVDEYLEESWMNTTFPFIYDICRGLPLTSPSHKILLHILCFLFVEEANTSKTRRWPRLCGQLQDRKSSRDAVYRLRLHLQHAARCCQQAGARCGFINQQKSFDSNKLKWN